MSESLPESLDPRHLRLIQFYTRAIAHALNNSLAGASGYQQLLALKCQRGDTPSDEKITEYLVEIEKSLLEAEQMIRCLSAWAKPPKPDIKPQALGIIINRVLDRFLESHPDARDRLHRDIPDGFPPVPTDDALLERILLEILDNARRATEQNQGKIHVSLGRTAESGGGEGERETITVQDTGCGMDPQRKPFLHLPLLATFRPNHTSPEGWRGIGFGLPTAFSYAQSLNATLEIESEPGGGTTVTLDLPENPPVN